MSRFTRPLSQAFGVLLSSGLLIAATGCVTHPEGPHGPMCATIDAARTIQFSEDRHKSLSRIASNANLSQHEQTYLVNAICLGGGYGDDMANALIVLIKNPSCTQETRDQIAKQLGWVAYSDARQRVVDAMIENPGKVEASGG